VHAHWEIEVPDLTGALQGRFEVLFGNQTTGVIGMDKTIIATNLADFNVRCDGVDHTGTYQLQELRLSAAAGSEKPLTFSNDSAGGLASRRWKVRTTSDAETGSNAGSNFQVVRFDDSGNSLDSPIAVTRSSGQVQLGPSGGVLIARSGGVALSLSQTATGATGVQATLADTTSVFLESEVNGDSANRFAAYVDGTLQWGSGAANRDTNLYRSSASILKTDYYFQAVEGLMINTTSRGGGVGVLAMANAATAPASTPTGGGVLYASAGALLWKGSNGTVTTIASA
jgi:hypothetical protein